jgi:hypothetical protein
MTYYDRIHLLELTLGQIFPRSGVMGFHPIYHISAKVGDKCRAHIYDVDHFTRKEALKHFLELV